MSKYHCLTVERMPEGGFVVFEGRSESNRGNYCGPLFACSAIGDALAFVRDKLDPAATSAAAFAPNGKVTPPPPGISGGKFTPPGGWKEI